MTTLVRDPRLTESDRRLLRSAAPTLLAGAVTLLVPVIARGFLDDRDYALWALMTTVTVSTLLLDLGASVYVQSSGYGRWPRRDVYARAVAMSTAGSVVATVLALGTSLLVRSSAPLSDLTTGSIVALVLATGAASAVRGAFTVLAARLQVAEAFRLRTVATMVQVGTQVALVVAGLALGAGVWTLPCALAVSSALALGGGHAVLRRRVVVHPPAAPAASPVRFAVGRTAAALVAVVASQADRWVLVTVADPAFVADYDLALRFAALPLGLVVVLAAGLVPESASLPDGPSRRAHVRRATRLCLRAVVPLSLAVLVSVLVVGLLGLVPLSARTVLLLGLGLVWCGVSALTAPTTQTLVGVGRPQAELWYAVPSVLLAGAGWLVAVAAQSPLGVPLATGTATVVCSAAFTVYGLRFARYEPGSRPTTHPR
ncbi:lipopolysaccharide biosynthesis protein [Phycicoccus jejuensis]|uniref:lipopolysaccharide biosynthesis protein n=1 Tax=Phycicoccus jejuensis TaxID=367299 RepID=UPI0004C42B8C|nr:hypothetical protein [Phycicoccus jejuensis]